MTLYKNSKADMYEEDGRTTEDYPCEVRIDNGSLVISYKVDGAFVTYSGNEIGNGHFELFAPSVNGKSIMHLAPESDVLEGSWVEAGARGMWQIWLEE